MKKDAKHIVPSDSSLFRISLNEDTNVIKKNNDISQYEESIKCFDEKYLNQDIFAGCELSINDIPNTQDSINQIELLENKSVDGYILKTKSLDSFDNSKYDELIHTTSIIKQRIIFKFPSRMYIENEKEIRVKIRIVKNRRNIDSNTLIKLVSDDYFFSQTIIKVDEDEKEIVLRKKEQTKKNVIKVKTYMDNEIIDIKMIDLLSREIWE